MTKQISDSPCFCTNLRRSANSISAFYDMQLKETGITASQYHLLIHLSRLKKANITHWAKQVGLERGTMIRNIKVLQSHDWIENAEGHGKTFALSPAGEAVLAKALPIWQKSQTAIEQTLGADDTAAILRIAQKLRQLDL